MIVEMVSIGFNGGWCLFEWLLGLSEPTLNNKNGQNGWQTILWLTSYRITPILEAPSFHRKSR